MKRFISTGKCFDQNGKIIDNFSIEVMAFNSFFAISEVRNILYRKHTNLRNIKFEPLIDGDILGMFNQF